MSSTSISPGAALLRASRMFAVPAPLPKPPPALTSTVTFGSNTATVSHPTHLTITTPTSSLTRGDWGLKRSLPLRSTTRTQTPLVRVKAMDTFEHITDFASAADHTLTLQKFQELNMPISTPPKKEDSALSGSRVTQLGPGVFEQHIDITTRNQKRAMDGKSLDDNRWKFKGPWLAGQTDGEFNDYIRKSVRGRRSDFRQYLRENKAKELNKAAQLKASQDGQEAPASLAAEDITEEQLRDYIKHLRHNRSEVFGLIREFLDLPYPPTRGSQATEYFNELLAQGSKPMTINAAELPKNSSPYSEQGPPKTHPSAGLSYLRSKSHLYNHPIYGPQQTPPPITGRVLVPKNASNIDSKPKLGIAGLVVDAPPGSTSSSHTRGSNRTGNKALPGMLNIDPDTERGTKVELQPETAMIDPQGRIIMEVSVASEVAAAVKNGTVDEITVRPTMPHIERPEPLQRPAGSPEPGYGLGGGREDFKWRQKGPRDVRTKKNDSYAALDSIFPSERKL